MKKTIEVKEELIEVKQKLYNGFDDVLANVIITKGELEKFKESLMNQGVEQKIIERESATYHIRKKLGLILNEVNIHNQIDTAILFLDEVLEKAHLKEVS